MKRNILLCGLLLFLLAWGCHEDDELVPSGIDKDWLVIEDDPNDPITHLRYTIYRDYGVSVFFNDTLGVETRYDRYGNPYTHYETLKVGYNLTTNSSPAYVLADDEADMLATLEAMNEYLFPVLPADQRPVTYLMVDTLRLSSNTTQDIDYYKYLRTTCVGNIERFKTMSDSARRSSMAELAGVELVEEFLADFDTLMKNQFDSVALNVRLDASVYTPVSFPRLQYGVSTNISTARQLASPEWFGFLHYRAVRLTSIDWPTKDETYAAFMGLVLSKTEEEVYEQYNEVSDSLVLQRYELMRQMMRDAGLIEGGEAEDPEVPESTE